MGGNLFETTAVVGLLPPSCVAHFGKKRPTCACCGKALGVDRSPVPGLGGWFCTDWCRRTAEKDQGALEFEE